LNGHDRLESIPSTPLASEKIFPDQELSNTFVTVADRESGCG